MNSYKSEDKYHFLTNDFSSLRDTLYTFDSNYVEVNLALQKAFLHKRNGEVKEFLISSGTARVLDGVETQEGLFVIKAKLKEWHSRQFDSTLLINWIGFNHGIGFHALQGNGYYRYLGRKRSSHGCIRVSRESSDELYKSINIGTPVLVHSGNNAVSLGFADMNDNYSSPSYYELTASLPERLDEIYEGRYFISHRPKLMINSKNVYHSGLPIGDSRKIPKQQRIVPEVKTYPADPDKLSFAFKYEINRTASQALLSSENNPFKDKK
jgi:hypothetical protein